MSRSLCSFNGMLYKFGIPSDRFLYDILEVRCEMLSRLPVEVFWINRFPILDDHMGFPDTWKLIFEYGGRVVETDRNNGTSCFICNFKRTFFKRKKSKFLAFISCSFREDADADPIFYILDGLEDRLHPFFRVVAVQKQTVEKLHPCGEKRDFFHFFFCHISRFAAAPRVCEKNIKETSVVPDEKYRFVFGYIFFPYDSYGNTGNLQDTSKSPLDDPEG